MTTLREAAQQALEAMEETQRHRAYTQGIPDAITALRDALAQEEQEPAIYPDEAREMGLEEVALYTYPPRREWQNLTMQEINALPEIGGVMWRMGTSHAVVRALRAVERALKEKNA
jgi:hypothetical protein